MAKIFEAKRNGRPWFSWDLLTRFSVVTHAIAVSAALTISGMALAGYIFNIPIFYAWSRPIPISLNASIAIFVLSFAEMIETVIHLQKGFTRE